MTEQGKRFTFHYGSILIKWGNLYPTNYAIIYIPLWFYSNFFKRLHFEDLM